MSESKIDEIKYKLSVEEVISEYLQLQKAGRNLKANCPFHNEKTPSFIVSPERQIWHCFGCGEGGDIFSFVMKIEGLEFVGALKILAEKAGVTLKNENFRSNSKKDILLEIIDISKKFYQECLKTKKGREAYEYLTRRGLKEDTITEFQLGYAPDSWDLLSKFLKTKKYKDDEIFLAGMTVKRESGVRYDRFRDRIMFPINNISGKTIGFSARIMPNRDENQAKYINTPETALYNKGRILYGIDKSKVHIRKKDLCIMMEGNMDVIASFQVGVKNVAAASGTSLTSEQIRIIKRYTNNIAFSFDADSAGIKAANRGIDMALEGGMNVNIIQIPKGKDPADCVKSNPDLWIKSAENPKQVMKFYFDSAFSEYDPNKVEDKKRIASELLNIIRKISNKIEQSHYLQALSEKLNVDERVLAEILNEIKIKKTTLKGTSSDKEDNKYTLKKNSANREKQLQKRLIGFISACPIAFTEISSDCDLEELLSDKKLKKIFCLIKDFYLKKNKLELENQQEIRNLFACHDDLLKNEENKLLPVFDAITLEIENESEKMFDVEQAWKETKTCIDSLKKIKLQKDLKNLERDIKTAGKENDYESQKLLMKEFNKCIDELNKIDVM